MTAEFTTQLNEIKKIRQELEEMKKLETASLRAIMYNLIEIRDILKEIRNEIKKGNEEDKSNH